MIGSSRSEALALAAGLLVLGTVPRDLGNWRLFGSWALLLMNDGMSRIPRDIDIQVQRAESGVEPPPKSLRIHHDEFTLTRGEAHPIRFSDPERSPEAYWQQVEVCDRAGTISTETVNWVYSAGALPTHQTEPMRLQTTTVFELACSALPGLREALLSDVIVASQEECIAQKWTRLAITRSGDKRHTRWVDLADIYDLVLGPETRLLQSALQAWLLRSARERGIDHESLLIDPPAEWDDYWDFHNFSTGIARPTPARCATDLYNYVVRGA